MYYPQGFFIALLVVLAVLLGTGSAVVQRRPQEREAVLGFTFMFCLLSLGGLTPLWCVVAVGMTFGSIMAWLDVRAHVQQHTDAEPTLSAKGREYLSRAMGSR